jgi:two-component system chemotaxis sensor kinase CheA
MSNDSLLNDFLAECREHLEGIETDLLAIEGAGEKADPELVNKVFRAAHSIKGGAGFFNLDKIKLLGHKTETALDMIRSKKMAPSAEAINILLTAFDLLREMVNNPDSQHQVDVGPQVTALQELAETHLSGREKVALRKLVTLSSPDGAFKASIQETDLQAACNDKQYIYLIEYDMLHDIDQVGKSPVALMHALSKMGVIIDSIINLAAMGTLDDEPTKVVPLHLIYRTVLDPDMVDAGVEVPRDKIHCLMDPTECSREKSTEESAAIHQPSASVEPPAADPQVDAQPVPIAQPDAVAAESPSVGAASPAPTTPHPASAAPETLRINVEALDTLMTQAGELVLGRNQLLDAIARQDGRAIVAAGQRISFVTSELQEAVMRTRLQSVGNVFNKFTRVVRDMAIAMKKEINLQLEGKDVELDKTIIEGLSDPLTHMVRNAVDHGIEPPAERKLKGKSAIGAVCLRAYHEAGQVTIELSDDGKGIDSAKVAAKALKMQLITAERLQAMSEDEKRALVFLPGLSTADKITETSGRGVGMDVVKTNLDRLGGKVEIRSELGKGTTFRIKLPLTLAIIPSLIISERNERYAIPQVNVVELHRIPAAQIQKRIGLIGDAEVLVLRGELIPLVRFADVLGILPTYIDPETGNEEIDRRKRIADRRSKPITAPNSRPAPLPQNESGRAGKDRRYHAVSDLNIAIVSSGLLQYGLVVDQLHNTEEIVVKPLGRHFKGQAEYAGATIMGDGDVALILDAAGIALKADIASASAAARMQKNAIAAEAQPSDSAISLLLFDNMPGEQCAIPLDLVQRVERINKEQIETLGGRRTMQYRGTLLSLIQLSDVAGVNPVPLDGELAVVVTSAAGHDIGILGIMPVSVVESQITVDTQTHRQQGISGSAIINGKTVLMVDIFGLVDVTHPEWTVAAHDTPTIAQAAESVVLLAEDSDFFRGQVTRYIQESGLNVISARDGLEAWELLKSNVDRVSIVVTDIEMPRMTGLELAKAIRADGRFVKLPIIALTSLAGEEDEAKGKAAGIDDYQVKVDRDRLLEGLKRAVEQGRSGN